MTIKNNLRKRLRFFFFLLTRYNTSLGLCFENIIQCICGNKEDLQSHEVFISLEPVLFWILFYFFIVKLIKACIVSRCAIAIVITNRVGRKKHVVFCLTILRRLNEYVGKWIGIIEKIKVLCNLIRTSSILWYVLLQ